MFNLETNAMAAQIAAKSIAEKKALLHYWGLIKELGTAYYDVLGVLDQMAADENISTQTFVSFAINLLFSV